MYIESTDVLDATSNATATTTEPTYVASYAAVDVTGKTLTPANTVGSLTGSSAKTIVGSPASGVQRALKFLNIRNVDTVSHTITVRFNRSSTPYTLLAVDLLPGESLVFTPENGFVAMNTQGAPKAVYTSQPLPRLLERFRPTANITTALTIGTTGTLQIVYVGACPASSSQMRMRLNVTTAAATITWAEVAILAGDLNFGSFPASLKVLGWADVSAVINSTGLKLVTVSLSVQPAAAGDIIWAAVGNVATTSAGLRATSIVDHMAVGHFVTAAPPTRPSTAGATISPNGQSANAVPWLPVYVD